MEYFREASRNAPLAGEEPARGRGGLAGDLRYAWRGLRRQPGFAISSVLTLALAIGANTALYSVADRVLLRPLPYADPDRLVTVWDTRPADGRDHEHPSPGNFLDWSTQCASFEGMAAWMDGSGAATLRSEGDARVVETVKVTPSFFRVLGKEPLLGRTFDPGRERGGVFNVADRYTGGDLVLVMSHGFWMSRFGGDPTVVGRKVNLDGAPWEVIGVMPPSFALPRPTTELFIPWDIVPSYAGFEGGPPRDYRFLNVVARLRRDRSPRIAEADLQGLAAGLAAEHPKANAGWSVRLVGLREELVGSARPVLLLLAGAVVLILLLGCANVTSLQLARAAGRRREMAVRLSLGASRPRLVRQLLTESLVIGALGGAAGLVLAKLALVAIAGQGALGWLESEGAAFDGRVLAFAAALTLGTALLFGLAPALEASRASITGSLQDGGHSATGGPRVRRVRNALVVGEVAVALVLLTGAGLLGRSLLRVLAVDTGFDPHGLVSLRVSLRVSLDHAHYATAARSRAFYGELMPRLASLPGVRGAGAVTALPLSPVGTDFARPWWREGEADPGGLAAKADIRMATPGYFDALRMTLRRGRAFTQADGGDAPRVIVVNDTLARQAFGREDPVGRRLILDYLGGAYPYEVVGVVNDVRFGSVKAAPRPELFIPHAQNPYLDLTVVVRADGDAAELVRRVEAEIRSVDPEQPAHSVALMEDLVRRSSSTDRNVSALLALFAALALVLTATGIQGLLSFVVAQRSRELGLRQALGATPRQMGRLVLRESLRLVVAGFGAGLALSLTLLPLVAGLLYEVRPTDPVAWGAAALGVLVVALGASLVPAHGATLVDPLVALREE
jgi:putative ABC transport system permease protein